MVRRWQWVPVSDLVVDSDDFPAIGETLIVETQVVRAGKLGEAIALPIRQRSIVDYTAEWMDTHRSVSRDLEEAEDSIAQ